MIRRARLLAVIVSLAAGALGVISSTQTWLVVTVRAGGDELLVPGASAIAVLAPLSLAALALGAALSIAGLALRYVIGALTLGIGVPLGWLTAAIVFAPPTSAVASTVTAATGITGLDAVAALIAGVSITAWPVITLVGWIALIAAGALTLLTARRWRGAGRRYRTDASAAASATPDSARAEAHPLDAVDSWDDLSRGEDPTGGSAPLDSR